MANFDVRYTFTANTTARSDEVNTNFAEIETFLNNEVVHRDGSTSFSGIPTLPADNPTSSNHAVRKAYVDWTAALRASEVKVARGFYQGTTDANGILGIPHGLGKVPGSAHATGAQPEQGSNAIGACTVPSMTSTHIVVRAYKTNGAPLTNTAVNVRWSAIP